jgi:hypothetical protein
LFSQNVFTGIIDDSGNIWDFVGGRKNAQIGIDLQKEQALQKDLVDLQEIVDNYYSKLVELGVITRPKSAEEIAQEQINLIQNKLDEQTAINLSLVDTLQKINEDLKEMRSGNGNYGHDNKQSSSSARKKSSGIKAGD